MSWRFRRSFKLLPGVRLNLGKKSAGLSFGTRGARYSVNTRGETNQTLGVPGSGLSYIKRGKLGQSGRLASATASVTPLLASSLVQVVGESFRQEALEATARSLTAEPPLELRGFAREARAKDPPDGWFLALLFPEPDNEHDPNAIAVWSQLGHIGYLGREDAVAYGPVLAAVRESGETDGGACPAFLRRASNGMWAAILALGDPESCLETLRLEDAEDEQ